MKITIKKLKTLRGHEGPAVDCDVCLNNKTFAIAQDDGLGGGLFIHATGTDQDSYNVNRETLKKVEAFVKKTYNQNLDEYVDELINASLRDKENKKRDKDALKGIMIGNDYSYHLSYWKGVKTLDNLLKNPNGKTIIQKAITDIKKSLKPGERILNADTLKKLGLKV
jgi:hypothetical protein